MTMSTIRRLTSGAVTTYVWIILCALVLTSYWLGPAPVASVAITVAVLAMGLIKARLIIQYFMEVRTAPPWLRATTDAWLLTLFGAVLGIYLW